MSATVAKVAVADSKPAAVPRDPVDMVRQGILRAIHQGALSAGQRLVEGKLSDTFGVGRGHVREALARLHAEGVIEIVPFCGARVRSFSPEEARNIDLTITALMALAARQAAGRIDGHGRAARLHAAMRDMGQFDESADCMGYVDARTYFYETIIEISGNSDVGRICPLIQGQITKRQIWATYDRAAHEERLARYRAVYEAILGGDGPGAEAAFWNTLIFDRP